MPREKLEKGDIPTLVNMRKRGLFDKDLAAYLGVRPDTFSKWINHPVTEYQRQLSQELKKAETEAKGMMLEAIQKAAIDPKTWQAAAWWLERKYPEEYARPEVRLQRDMMRENTEQLVQGFEGVVVKIREAAYRGNQPDA